MKTPNDRMKKLGRNIDSQLKWILSAVSAALTTSFVLVLESGT